MKEHMKYRDYSIESIEKKRTSLFDWENGRWNYHLVL